MRIVDIGNLFGLPTANVFSQCRNVEVIVPQKHDPMDAFEDADLVCFGGGEDIHPSLYGSRDVASMVGPGPSVRDRYEIAVFNYCTAHGIPMFGICRGAQFLCAMSGGKLVQDAGGHGGMHTLSLDNGRMLPMTSTHHQMMYPWKVNHMLLAWTGKRSREYTHDIPDYIQPDKDPEVVFFPDTRALAVQGHPEWMDPNCATVIQVRNWLKDYLHINLKD